MLPRIVIGAYRHPDAASRCSDAAPFSRTASPLSRYERADYGSTADAGALVGVKPLAKVGPTVHSLVDWLYSSE